MNRSRHLVPAMLTGFALLIGSPLRAQGPGDLIARGVTAYDALDLDAAAGWLRRALTSPVVESLTRQERMQALAYLGATEVYRHRTDSAQAAFRRLVRLEPRYRLDPLTFPPEVSNLFEMTRVETKVIAIRIASDTSIQPRTGRLSFWLVPSTDHRVEVAVTRTDGRIISQLYSGPVGDSLPVTWAGTDSSGATTTPGPLWLTVISEAGGPRRCQVQVPIELLPTSVDTVPLPLPLGPEGLLPEQTDASSGRRAATTGALLGVAALLMPHVMAPNAATSGDIIVVPIAALAGGLIGSRVLREGRPLPANVALNDARRAERQRQIALARADNDARRRDAALRFRSGPSVTSGCGAP